MHFTKSSICLLAGATAVAAIPLEASTLHRLVARGARYDTSCDRKIPNGDGKTYKDKAQSAFGDANTLAQYSQTGEDSKKNAFTESTAYSHYFADGDKDKVKAMMQVIYNSRLPDDENHEQGYTFDIKCGSDQDDDCDVDVLAATSARPGEPNMVLCDRFFNKNTKQTKQDLGTKKFVTKRGGWCQTGEDFPFFEVAGLTLFHEMTHMHMIGQSAGLTARPDPDGYDSAGTVDVYVKGGDDDRKKYKDKDPWQAARELKRLWDVYDADDKAYKPTTPTIENAESYAAAALEFYFLGQCKWDVILPK